MDQAMLRSPDQARVATASAALPRPRAVGTRPPPYGAPVEQPRLGIYLVIASLAIIAGLLALSAL
jgi:hypothetical protein